MAVSIELIPAVLPDCRTEAVFPAAVQLVKIAFFRKT
jgi:hypothetical protein